MSNVMKIRFDHTYPALELSFKRCTEGTQAVSHTVNTGNYRQITAVNERYPEIAGKALSLVIANEGVHTLIYKAGPLGAIWFHDDWQTPVNDREQIPRMPSWSMGVNPVFGTIFTDLPAGQFGIFNASGKVFNLQPVYKGPDHTEYDISGLGQGIYFYYSHGQTLQRVTVIK